MSPQDAFWNSWLGISIGAVEVLAILVVACVAIAFLKRRLRITVAWQPPTKSGN